MDISPYQIDYQPQDCVLQLQAFQTTVGGLC